MNEDKYIILESDLAYYRIIFSLLTSEDILTGLNLDKITDARSTIFKTTICTLRI